MLIVGFDSEYQRYGGARNDVVCISFACVDPETENTHAAIKFIADGRDRRCRLTLPATLSWFLADARQAGAIDEIPVRIILAAHFSRADLPGFRDFGKLKSRVDSPRKTFATITKPLVWTLRGKRVSATLVDTRLLAPAGHQSLEALGRMLDLPKLELPEGAISRMREFWCDEPETFRAYAIRDAQIAARYILVVYRFFARIGALGRGRKLPPTIGSAAVNLFKRITITRGVRIDRFLGHVDDVNDHLTVYAECFHGGRSEAFAVGYTPRTTIYDLDLRGAYPSAMAHLCEPAWENTRITRNPRALAKIDHGLGFARVRFRFPPETRHPSLPVRAGQYGLVFPLAGTAWCTGFELAVALDQGAEIEVEHGMFVPWRSEVQPFAEFTRAVTNLRESLPQGSLMERLVKEMGNSLYGKVAQAINAWRPSGGNAHRVFDSRSGEMRDMPASAISSAPIAASVTGLVRATLGEILALMPPEHSVFSATTDGLLTTCPPDELRFGRVARLFAAARKLVAGSADIIEVKHQVRQVLIIKTRGAFSTEPVDPAQPPVIARAGHRIDPRPADPWEECRQWEQLYRSREYDWRRSQKVFPSLRVQHEKDQDLVDVERIVRVNFEPDMKRQLVDARDVEGILAADTRPWGTLEEFISEREAFDTWRRSRRRVMKTAADHADFVRWRAENPTRRAIGSKGDRTPLATLFIRAWARRLLGLPGGNYAELAEAMTSAGFTTSVDAIKKALRRGRLPEEPLETLSESDASFVRWALARWPSFAVDQLVAPRCLGAGAPTESSANGTEDVDQRRTNGTGRQAPESAGSFGRCHLFELNRCEAPAVTQIICENEVE